MDEFGFLLFEDMKKGWEEELKPDYVLIDSRTGDTDVLGICTRQLPDSVVLMFTPNEQNLAGLENVCRDIRREETEGLKKKIRLHFVAANVPDLDDEQHILRRQIQAFRERLSFKDLSGVIRRYENLNLLDQSVFVLDRPHSRLARSYRRLLRTLIKDNFTDREGVLIFLEDYGKLDPASRPPDKCLTTQEVASGFPHVTQEMLRFFATASWVCDEPLNEIAKHFSDDVEVLNKLADYCILKEDYDNAVNVLDRVLQLRSDLPDSRFERALCRAKLGDVREAADDLVACLHQSNQDSNLTKRCLDELREIAPHRLSEAADVLSAHGFPGLSRLDLAEYLCKTEVGIPRAAQLLRDSPADSDEEAKAKESGELSELLLRARCWKEAIQLLEEGGLGELSPHQLVCLALAYWGENGEMPEALCRLALERGQGEQESGHTLDSQVKSWLHWRLGNKADAISLLNEAEEFGRGERDYRISNVLSSRPIGGAFSLWRYRFVSVEQFLDDCRLVRRLFQGEPIRPAFLGAPDAANTTRTP
jgi:tetratricopeptide (TPR) repeat protein